MKLTLNKERTAKIGGTLFTLFLIYKLLTSTNDNELQSSEKSNQISGFFLKNFKNDHKSLTKVPNQHIFFILSESGREIVLSSARKACSVEAAGKVCGKQD